MRSLFACICLIFAAASAAAQPVAEADLRAHVEILAGDDFAGRYPGTEGETKTLHYLALQWHAAGLVGTADDAGGWYQPVDLVPDTDGKRRYRLAEIDAAPVEDAPGVLRSYNIVARLPGSDPATGAVVIMGHWDHLGRCGEEGAQDRICNGAVDNASGLAVMIEVAKRLAAGPRPGRDVYFLGTTAEEMGLLGARAFVADPPVPLGDIVAVLNIDTFAVAPRGTPLAVIGRGETAMADDVERIARGMGRAIDESGEANAFLYRQDGWIFLREGIPAVMATGAFGDAEILGGFLKGRYHSPGDEADGALELGGAAEDAELHVALARYFADPALYPGMGTGE